MLVREMSQQECESLLARVGRGRLACVRDNQPYIVPIYFGFEPGRLYGFATMGQKIEWLRLNPLVCVEADEVLSHTEWQSVVVLGSYEEFSDIPEHLEERLQVQARLEQVNHLWWDTGFAAAQVRERFDRDITLFYCIHIQKITGRRASSDPVEQR